MKKLLIPILLLFFGTGSGIGAAILLKDDTPDDEIGHLGECPEPDHSSSLEAELLQPEADEVIEAEYAKLENQFVVPVLVDDKVSALVVLTINVEVPVGGIDLILAAEPKLRDKFLGVLFEHANLGGFSGNFTSSSNMRILREELLASARRVVGRNARDVLILDIVRQDS